MKIERFEDLEIWQEARELFRFVFSVTSSDPFKKDFKPVTKFVLPLGQLWIILRKVLIEGAIKNLFNFYLLQKGVQEKYDHKHTGLLMRII